MNIRIPLELLKEITNTAQERNIYAHPNPLARDIFWQRLEKLYKLIQRYAKRNYQVLDLGGGSGMFTKALSSFFQTADIIDMDNNDARKIIDYFKIKNANLFDGDINEIKLERRYQAIIAADVLEHFYNLDEPLTFLRAHLEKDGLLFISVPTENWLYIIGRILIGKKKPDTHYHSSKTIINFLVQNGFKILKKTSSPAYIINIPLFEIAILKYSGL